MAFCDPAQGLRSLWWSQEVIDVFTLFVGVTFLESAVGNPNSKAQDHGEANKVTGHFSDLSTITLTRIIVANPHTSNAPSRWIFHWSGLVRQRCFRSSGKWLCEAPSHTLHGLV